MVISRSYKAFFWSCVMREATALVRLVGRGQEIGYPCLFKVVIWRAGAGFARV